VGEATEVRGVVFGPVHSRRLGVSLGVNNLAGKECTYSCVYCQAGRTPSKSLTRRVFRDPTYVVNEVVRALHNLSVRVDYVTFVPDGEPTLDACLGYEVSEVLRSTGARVAVITNGSLLWRADVREDLLNASLVSVKIDCGSEEVFRRINRPHELLSWSLVLDGILKFSKEFTGRLITETMLVEGVNDSPAELRKISEALRLVGPDKAYIMVPVRPPAERWVRPPTREFLREAAELISEYLGRDRVHLLASVEGRPPAPFVGEGVLDSLARLTKVHPLKLDYALETIVKEARVGREEALKIILESGAFEVVRYGDTFFVRVRRDG